MHRFLRPWRCVVALALVLAPAFAHAQGVPVFQSGLVPPGHVMKGAGNGLQMDAGGLTGDVNGRGVSPFAITDSLGLGLCTHSAATGGQHYEFCLGHDASGNALLSATANGGAVEKSIYFSKNGTLYEIPFTGAGGGNMVGPNASTVDHASCWNNTSGSLTSDCGAPPELSVANNTALKAVIGTHIASIRRNGFSSAGDGGALRYVWSAVNCTAADDGAQVQPSGTGCWIADFNGTTPTPKVWGAAGDGSTDDTTKVQAAINAMGSTTLANAQKKLRVFDHFYCVTALTIPSTMTIEGSGPPVAATEGNGGLKACSANASLITVTGNGSTLRGLVVNGNGGNTSGFAIKITGNENRIENNHINGFCTYIYNIGRHNIVNGNVLTDNVNPSDSHLCDAIVDGDATAATVGSIYTHNLLTTWGPNAAGSYHSGMLFQNSGGPWIAFNDIQRTNYGTLIKPLADKTVSFAMFESTVLGDTTNADGMYVTTTNANSRVEILKINNSYFGRNGDWPGTFTWAAARNMTIETAGGGLITGVHINGTAFNTASDENIAVGGTNVTDVTIDNSTLCFPGQGTASSNIALLDTQAVAIRNNTIGAGCNQVIFDDTKTNSNISFVNTGSAGSMQITGNQFYGTWQLGEGPITDTGTAIPNTSLNTIADNFPLDSQPLSVASAASIDPLYYPVVYITGTTNVTDIQHPWQGRKITVFTPGGFTFATGGTAGTAICANKVMGANAVSVATYLPVSNCWAIQ